MTQYKSWGAKKNVEDLRTKARTQDNLSYCKRWPCCERTTWTKPRRPQTKASWAVNVRWHLTRACKDLQRSCRLSGRVAWLPPARRATSSGGLKSRRRPGKIKDKKSEGRAPRLHLCLFDCLWRSRQTDGTRQNCWRDSSENPNDMVWGHKEKPRQQVDLNVLNLYHSISDRRLFDNGADELNDKQGKKIKKKVKMVV